MATPFPEIKAFPANPRVVIGDNRAPLDQQIVIDFNEDLESEGIISRIKQLSDKGSVAPECKDADTAGKYADTVRLIVAARKSVEESREKLNRPLLNAQRALKGRADAVIAPLDPAEKNLRAKVKAFRDTEAAKAAEAARIATEERRKAEKVAEEERQRLQAIADAEAQKERDRLQAIEDQRAASSGQEAATVIVESAVVEVAPVFLPEAEPVEAPSIQGEYGAKVGTTTTWKHEIISVRQLPDNILKNEKVIEALNKVIGAQVRGGTREIKGCRIFSETGIAIR